MSREERRAYQRQMKGIERGPQLPSSARARSERNAARRAAGRPASTGPAPFDGRFWLRSALIAVALGFLAFSLQWGEGMPWALYVGLIVGGIALAILVAFRFLQRRLPSRS
ncbi:MAG TPA: hypothetical protein VFW95_10415 [Candidatus Limnocylindria bacterium]|nr:hypothetical protein [Candidatus Limnocylindria bacterium]